MSIINANGWPHSAITQPRPAPAIAATEPSANYLPQPMTAVVAASKAESGNGASQQSSQDAQDEAFAKLKVALQNPETIEKAESQAAPKTATQEFHDYMALSPAEKIRLKLLNELGMTEEDYNNLPPEKKDEVDRKIAQRMKEEIQQQSMANLQPHMEAVMASQELTASLTSLEESEALRKAGEWKDPHKIEDPLS